MIKKKDTDFSALIRSRGKCERCGKTKGLQPSHIISRKYMALRWDEDNAICLCTGCHIFWWHKEPVEATRWLEVTWPGRYDKLNEKRIGVI